MNKTNQRIIKLWLQGNHSLESIAKKIGRPGNVERVKQAIGKEIIKALQEDLKNEK